MTVSISRNSVWARGPHWTDGSWWLILVWTFSEGYSHFYIEFVCFHRLHLLNRLRIFLFDQEMSVLSISFFLRSHVLNTLLLSQTMISRISIIKENDFWPALVFRGLSFVCFDCDLTLDTGTFVIMPSLNHLRLFFWGPLGLLFLFWFIKRHLVLIWLGKPK